jgi:hypothetical protein
MPSPLTFKKKIMLWVDDKPNNNVDLIKRLENEEMEILQLTSTEMA